MDGMSDIPKLVRLDPKEVEAAGDDAELHPTYHRTIVLMGGVFALLGALASVFVVAQLLHESGENTRIKMIVGPPIFMTVAGFCFGVAAACLVAPTSFLTGPLGRKWMKFIGTQSVPAARVVCFFVCLALLTATIIGTVYIVFFAK